MATKNISITEEAYSRLASLKKDKESFSEIINRITGRRSIMDFAGILSRESADKLERHVVEFRERYNKDAKKRLQRILEELSK